MKKKLSKREKLKITSLWIASSLIALFLISSIVPLASKKDIDVSETIASSARGLFTFIGDGFSLVGDAYDYFFEEDPIDRIRRQNEGCTIGGDHPCALKPIIYLYPEVKTDVTVRLDYKGTLTSTYPAYDTKLKGWDVTASPDGSLINKKDGKPYSYLFWEGKPKPEPSYDLTTGFVVAGKDTASFLQDKLSALGLTPKEYNEMIVFWLPKMEHNKYNLIHFAGQSYTDIAPLTITPQPKSILRVFMVYKALEEPVSVKAQEIAPFKREGFTVIEWGGTEVK